jgi:hypothetical protein
MKSKYKIKKDKVSPKEKAALDKREMEGILSSFSYAEEKYKRKGLYKSASVIGRARKQVRSLLGEL